MSIELVSKRKKDIQLKVRIVIYINDKTYIVVIQSVELINET